MPSIDSARILILATDGYERSELRVPHDELAGRGATVTIASLEKRPIKSWAEKDWGDTIDVDLTAKDVVVEDYDAIVLPGGQINPDILRKDADAMRVVKGFLDAGKIVAAICHAPWLLVEADALRGRKATSYASIKTDLKNAGADWRDEKVVNDKLARQVFEGVLAGEGGPDEVVEKRGLAVVSDDGALGAAVDNAIAANPDVADKIRDGKVAAAGALIGAVMKEMRGQADAGRVRELILEKLS